VRLPDALERAIDLEASAVPGKALARAAESLSARYRDRPDDMLSAPAAQPLTDIERLAYAVVRAPATYAAVSTVLAELRARAPHLRVERLLDLGAGPGVATWATLARRGDLQRVTLIERDRGFIDLGMRLLVHARALDAIEWRCGDLHAASQPLPTHDLVVLSYALGELSDPRRIIERAWAATEGALVVIEPGTPFHFERVLETRDHLIREGAIIIAPCPHASACPMAGGGDWCHMPARVERTSLHRRLKAGALPYEDEKFSYVIAVRANESVSGAQRAAARIVRRPEVQKGFIALTLCTPSGLQREGVPRSQRDTFRRARKAAWGDAW
jgi:ribosomal protein RSM22 (predicted rRNA methylase)